MLSEFESTHTFYEDTCIPQYCVAMYAWKDLNIYLVLIITSGYAINN